MLQALRWCLLASIGFFPSTSRQHHRRTIGIWEYSKQLLTESCTLNPGESYVGHSNHQGNMMKTLLGPVQNRMQILSVHAIHWISLHYIRVSTGHIRKFNFIALSCRAKLRIASHYNNLYTHMQCKGTSMLYAIDVQVRSNTAAYGVRKHVPKTKTGSCFFGHE